MADERRYYGTNGAAAYDVYAGDRYSSAARELPRQEPQRRHLPQEQPQPQRRQRVRAKTAVAPFTLFGIAVVACMLVLVIFGYVQLFEASSNVSKLQSRLSALQQEKVLLQAKYDGQLDLRTIEQRAGELGLSAPKDDQIVYVSLAGSDRAEIYEEEKNSVVGEIVSAVEESISSLIAYLRLGSA